MATEATALHAAASIVPYIDIKNADDTASIGALAFATHCVIEKFKNEAGLITDDGQFFLHSFFKTLIKEGLDPMQARAFRDAINGEINLRLKAEEELKAKELSKKNAKKNAKEALLEKGKNLNRTDYYRSNNYRSMIDEQLDNDYDDDYFEEEEEEYEEEAPEEEEDLVAIAETKKREEAALKALTAKSTSGSLQDLIPQNKTKSKTLVLGGKK